MKGNKKNKEGEKWIKIPTFVGAIIAGIFFILYTQESESIHAQFLTKIEVELAAPLEKINGTRGSNAYMFFAKQYKAKFVIHKAMSSKSFRGKLAKLSKEKVIRISIHKLNEYELDDKSKKIPVYALKSLRQSYFDLTEYKANYKQFKLRDQVFLGIIVLFLFVHSFPRFPNIILMIPILLLIVVFIMRIFELWIFFPR